MIRRLVLWAFCLISLVAQTATPYSGTWTSTSSGGNGKLMLAFTDSAVTTATFTYEGQEVKTKPISYKKDSDRVDFVFEYSLDGNVLRSRMQGTVAEKSIKGKYQSSSTDGSPVDEGTWEVTQQ